MDLRLLGVRVSDFPRLIAPPDEHQRKLSQFFGQKTSQVIEDQDSDQPASGIDESEIDLFDNVPELVHEVKPEPISEDVKTSDIIPPFIAPDRASADDDVIVVSVTKKREAPPNGASSPSKRAKRTFVPVRGRPSKRGQSTLEGFLGTGT